MKIEYLSFFFLSHSSPIEDRLLQILEDLSLDDNDDAKYELLIFDALFFVKKEREREGGHSRLNLKTKQNKTRQAF